MGLMNMPEGDATVSPQDSAFGSAAAQAKPSGDRPHLDEQRAGTISVTSFMAQVLSATDKAITSKNPPIETPKQTSTPITVSQERVNYCVRTIQTIGEQGNVKALEQIREEVEAQRAKLGLKPVELVEQVRALVEGVHLVPPLSETLLAPHLGAASTNVATSLGYNSGLPAWFLDLETKLESGAIPRYAGKWHDGDPVEFLLAYYKEAVDARILTQAHLKALDRKLYASLNHTFINTGKKLSEILPPAVVFSKKSAT